MAARKIEETGATVTRLLRHQESREYFSNGTWTTDPEQAQQFGDALEAAAACARHNLQKVELTVRADPSGAELFALQLC